MKYRNWIGSGLIILSTVIAFTADTYQDQPEVAGWLYLAMTLLFVIGFAIGLDLSISALLPRKPVWNYTLSRGKLMIHYDCTLPVKLIGPSGKSIWVVIVDGNKLSIKDNKPEGVDLLIASSFGSLNLEVGRLKITREPRSGYRVEWSEDEDWKIG